MTMPPLPPGFKLEKKVSIPAIPDSGKYPPLPEGFVMEPQTPAGMPKPPPPNFGAEDANSFSNMAKSALRTAGDYGRTALEQGLQGATFGFADEVTDRLGAGIASVYTGEKYKDLLKEARGMSRERQQEQFQDKPVTSILSNIGGGLMTGMALAAPKVIAGAAPAAGTLRGSLNAIPEAGQALTNSLRSGNTLARVGKGVAAGAASGALYGAGSSTDGERLEGAGTGAAIGGALGGAFPAIGAAGSAVKNAILPKVDDALRPLAQKAMDYGIPLTRSQIGNSRFAKTLASTADGIPLSGSQKFYEKQSAAFNRAVAKTFGEDADKITPEVVDSAYKNIGAKFDQVTKGREIQITDDIMDQLAALEDDASRSLTGDTYQIVKKNISKFLKDISDDGKVSGEKINSFRADLARTLKRTRNDASPYLSDIQDIIVDATVDGLPGGRDLLNSARLQYKNLKTIESLAEKTTNGNINPALLLERVRNNFRDFSRGGGGELGDLARIGQAFLKQTVPNSGTTERAIAYGGFAAPGVLATGLSGSLPATLAALAAPAITARGFNAANTFQPLVRRAIGAAAKPISGQAALLAALLQGRAASAPSMLGPPAERSPTKIVIP